MSRAADELGITQSAVSHQIRQLERTLDIDLFIRLGRALRLSPAGVRLLSTVQESFDSIASTILTVNQDLVHGELAIATEPGFTFLWLTKRLPDFLERHPDLTLRRTALPLDEKELDLSVDVAVSQNTHLFPGRRVEFLAQLKMFPVCAASFVAPMGRLLPGDIKNHTLTHVDGGHAWSNWFANVGIDQTPPKRELFCWQLSCRHHIVASRHWHCIG